MTTGNSYDYNTEFINMRPSEDTRSIVELLQAEARDGYSGMTDTEISNLIEYKQEVARQSEIVQIAQREAEARSAALKQRLDEEYTYYTEKLHEAYIDSKEGVE